MDAFGLDENEFHLSSINIRDLIAKILKNANKKTGFEDISVNEKLLLQLYPDAHGGCELFLTRMVPDIEEDFFMPLNDEGFLLPKSIKGISEHKKTPLTYSFESLELAINACKELKKRKYRGESSLYRLDTGKYLIFILPNVDKDCFTNCLLEMGEAENTENSLLRSLERGSCIITQKAVEQLSLL